MSNLVKVHIDKNKLLYGVLFLCIFVIVGVLLDGYNSVVSTINIGQGYFKNNAHVYYGEEIVTDADPNYFELLGNDFARDSQHVYFHGKPLPTEDPQLFRILNGYYALDSQRVYYFHTPMIGADPKTFEIVFDNYARDAISLFYQGIQVKNIDAATFEVLDDQNNIVRDKNGIYQNLQLVNAYVRYGGYGRYGYMWAGTFHVYDGYTSGRVKKDFEELEGGYIRDSEAIYYQDRKIEGVDTDTFQVLGEKLARDKDHAIYAGSVLVSTDADTFELLGDGYARDKSSIYYIEPLSNFDDSVEAVILDARVFTFRLLGSQYATDDTSLFYEGGRIDDYDPSFHITNSEIEEAETNTAKYRGRQVMRMIVGNWKRTSDIDWGECLLTTYEGRQEIQGWYIWDTGYVDKQWMFRVAYADLDKLPVNIRRHFPSGDLVIEEPRIQLSNISEELQEKLKKASKEHPQRVVLTKFSTYCEGPPSAEVDEK